MLGEGASLKVLFAINVKSYLPMAAKFLNYLLPEMKILKSLNGENELKKFFFHENYDDEFILIESLLGPNLKT